MPPAPRRLDPAKRSRIEDLLAADPPLSFGKIGKEVGCSPKTVKNIADELGIDRSGSAPKAANDARRNLADAKWAALELDLLDDVDLARNLYRQAAAANNGRTAKDAMWAAGHAFDKARRLYDARSNATQTDNAKSMLDGLFESMQAALDDQEADE